MGLLGRAKSMVQGWAAPPPAQPQSYNVACPQGHRLSGYRTEGYQALRCPTCAEGIFVLPRSPLPEPPRPPSANPFRELAPVDAFPEDDGHLLTDPPRSSNAEIDFSDDEAVEIDWVDEAAPTSPPPDRPKAATAEPPRPKTKPAAPSKPKPKPTAAPAPVVVVVAQPTLAQWAWKHRNRLIPAAVFLFVLMAVGIRWRRVRLDDLPRVAEIGRTEGLRKLDAGQFDAAKQILATAAAAVDSLGGAFEGAASIKQAASEAAIFTDLVPEPLEGLLEEATTYRDVNDWSSHFKRLYRGRTVIIESAVSAIADPTKPGSAVQIDYRVFIGRGPKPTAVARIDLAGFKHFESTLIKVGDREIFGARLATLELDLATNEWVITFEPDSGVTITHIKALATIGWPPFEPIEEPQP